MTGITTPLHPLLYARLCMSTLLSLYLLGYTAVSYTGKGQCLIPLLSPAPSTMPGSWQVFNKCLGVNEQEGNDFLVFTRNWGSERMGYKTDMCDSRDGQKNDAGKWCAWKKGGGMFLSPFHRWENQGSGGSADDTRWNKTNKEDKDWNPSLGDSKGPAISSLLIKRLLVIRHWPDWPVSWTSVRVI